ncbi:hypothetical protein GOBAR_AA02287 [Gossypium barbadense]|uniref:NADH dehydrogenase [ubiquinone] 1 alpha subcomplex subunit 13 n=1 Tax=Gossypium barbadense TaxID=3634 RepID=A0A2P5YRT6_GOSBA|nr:hypothetical protein GOBAR_AA02287 [Gossypium barbadense]
MVGRARVQGGLKEWLVHALELNKGGTNVEVADFHGMMHASEQDYDIGVTSKPSEEGEDWRWVRNLLDIAKYKESSKGEVIADLKKKQESLEASNSVMEKQIVLEYPQKRKKILVKQWISDSLRVKVLHSNTALDLCYWHVTWALKEEKFAARRAVLPVLQAEEDERFVKEWKKYLEYEAEVMKDVPGWKVGENVYNSGRWMPPATGELRPEVW